MLLSPVRHARQDSDSLLHKLVRHWSCCWNAPAMATLAAASFSHCCVHVVPSPELYQGTTQSCGLSPLSTQLSTAYTDGSRIFYSSYKVDGGDLHQIHGASFMMLGCLLDDLHLGRYLSQAI
ncbi:hypothetical protein OPV22_018176 [Ensete ventricosum]|uniref:Uncharacterized protein n=1 Tax=Ensete ventricosum TaxID=4639 RepID=A0AAV8PIP2_ENSVE|nr:hypothetical protein OPV22_018176 [Ensete ventricosum]